MDIIAMQRKAQKEVYDLAIKVSGELSKQSPQCKNNAYVI